ncbi:MAG: ATP-dependent Clp protease proteolytic subunit [Paramuribaculum sp.]|nr:ATP-dependent Clp protease proteolytic subunit [Paramuribaculum sp.]
MNKLVTFVFLVALTYLNTFADSRLVYMLPLDDEIGSTTWQHTRRALAEAEQANADILLVHLNTYGGSVLHADSIRTALLHFNRPVVAFIDNNAASAGALIALACDSVFMRQDATMGAVTVVNGTDGAAMPDKYQSYMRAMMRATAESHGKDSVGNWRRNPIIAEAMVDPRVSVPGLIDSTRVLTFTAGEAVKWKFAEGTAESIDEVMTSIGAPDYRLKRFSPTWVDNLLGFFTNPAVQGILIMLIIGGIYFELQTPGMGFPSVVAIMAAVLYFLPLYLTGIASSWLVLLFLIGLLLLLLEIFVIPGFGIAGIAGAVFIAASLFIGLLENFSVIPGSFNMHVVRNATLTFILSIAAATGIIVFLSSKYAPKALSIHSELTHCQNVEDGYIGVDTAPAQLVGQNGIAETDMRPGGKVVVNGETFDAISLKGFIEAGTEITVKRYENAQLYVTQRLS